MCGICGFSKIDPNPNRSKTIIQQMCDTMIPRGPDDWGYYQDENIAIGMRRLSIIDLKSGHQPIANENKTIFLVCNGEIYNFRELKKELTKKGHYFSTNSDSEVIIHLYEDEGFECLNKLNGMFGLAVWDTVNKILFIARDRLGIKPLHFMRNLDGTFVFASEIKALLKYPKWDKKIDPVALNYYLTYESVPAPHTIFSGVSKLKSGHFLILRNGNINIKKYWDLNYLPDHNIKESEASEQFLDLFSHSVKRRMISDVPLGTFLSGGIDSSIISSFAQKYTKASIDSFNIGFREKSFDESNYARLVANYFNKAGMEKLNHHEEMFTSKQLLSVLPKITQFMDEPFADPSLLPTYLLCKFTRQRVTVALSGDGGDELFAGYPTYKAHKAAKFYLFIPKLFRKFIIEPLILNLPVSDNNFSLDFCAKRFISSIESDALIRHTIWMGALSPKAKNALYSKDLRMKMMKLDTFLPVKEYMNSAKVDNSLDALLYLDMKLYLQDDLLIKTDRTSMANSLEVRVPFLDHTVVDFCTKLPPNFKLKGLTSKYLLKRSSRRLLPKNIINRKKKGFGIPVAKWIKGELKELFQDVLSYDKIKREGLFDPEFVTSLLTDHLDCRYNNYKSLWTIFMFEKWLENYLDGTPAIDDHW